MGERGLKSSPTTPTPGNASCTYPYQFMNAPDLAARHDTQDTPSRCVRCVRRVTSNIQNPGGRALSSCVSELKAQFLFVVDVGGQGGVSFPRVLAILRLALKNCPSICGPSSFPTICHAAATNDASLSEHMCRSSHASQTGNLIGWLTFLVPPHMLCSTSR